MDMTLVDTTTH